MKQKSRIGILLFSFVILMIINSNAQSNFSFISLNNFSPPSPEAAALGRYGEIPVSLNTGVPSIDIPVYQIKSRKLSLPISFSYHASGIKVEDIATVAGLGWSLNAGGAISRSVVGIADERPNGMRNLTVYQDRANLENVSFDPNDYTNYSYLINLSNGSWDSQSDIYNINTPAFTGRFVYDMNKQIQWTPVDKQLNITWNSTDSTYKIIDDNGTQYIFGAKEYTEGVSKDITAWYPTLIVSSDFTDTIYFKYKEAAVFYDVFKTQTYAVTAPIDVPSSTGGSCPAGTVTGNFSEQFVNYSYYRKLLDTILFANGYVHFVYASDREDPGIERLSTIEIGSGNSVTRKITLTHSYFLSDDHLTLTIPVRSRKRLKLDVIKFTDNLSTAINQYSFTYNTTTILPFYYKGYSSGIPLNKTASYDLWGYYNGSTSDFNLPYKYRDYLYSYLSFAQPGVSATILNDYDSKSYNRYPNPSYTQACMLTGITYPTGGYTSFEYENNKIANNSTSEDYTGGLRVKTIKRIDSVNNTLLKIYKYGDSAGMGVSITRNIPENFYYPINTITQVPTSVFCYSSDFYISANPNTAINYYSGSPVFYTKVTEYDSAAGKNNGKTEYSFEYETDSSYNVPYVTKYWNFSTDKSWARGQLLTTKVYKFENQNYSLVKEAINTYNKLGAKTVKVGYLCEQMTKTTNLNLDGYLLYPLLSSSQYVLLNYFDYIDVVLAYGIKKLSKTEEKLYAGGNLVATKEFFYESPHHLYLTKTRGYTSDGYYIDEKVRYPEDKDSIQNLSSPALSAINGMISYNILSTPVQTEMYKNGILLIKNRTDYNNWSGSNRFYEQYLNQQVEQNAMEQRIEYKSYDERGNVTRFSKLNDVDISYIWDYKKVFPVAQVTNADTTSIAYTSFESDGKGRWIFTGLPRPDLTTVTGKRVYSLNGFSITRSGLSSSSTYIVSYWSKNGAQTVNSASAISGLTVNGWTYYEHTVINPASGLITISGTGVIDELRLYPLNAQMITYVYNPIIGVTSQCDINNRITYFEYDVLGRLIIVRDQDKNIVKNICYNYAGQTESCSFHFNEVRSQNFTRNNCGVGYVGSQLSYTVAAGTYYSTINLAAANALAQADIDANGQLYANNNGTCTVECNSGNCNGADKKCINNICEQGIKVYTSYFYNSTLNQCQATYHYEWSDASWSQNYNEYTSGVCPEEN